MHWVCEGPRLMSPSEYQSPTLGYENGYYAGNMSNAYGEIKHICQWATQSLAVNSFCNVCLPPYRPFYQYGNNFVHLICYFICNGVYLNYILQRISGLMISQLSICVWFPLQHCLIVTSDPLPQAPILPNAKFYVFSNYLMVHIHMIYQDIHLLFTK